MQIVLFLAIAFSLFIILSFISMSVLTAITGVSPVKLQDPKSWTSDNGQMIFYIRGLLLAQFLGLFLIPSLLFSFLSDPKPLQYLGMRPPVRKRFWILGFALMMVALPAAEYLGILNQKLSVSSDLQSWIRNREDEAARQIQFMLNRHTVSELILNLIFIAGFAGIGEELFFRGILQRLFIRAFKSPWAGIIFTGLLFSAFHFQFFGFLPRMLLGVLLGAIYWYSGSIWTSILAHFLYDAVLIVAVYFNPAMIKDSNATMMDPAQLAMTGILSAALTIVLILQMKKASRVSYADVYKDDPPKDLFSF